MYTYIYVWLESNLMNSIKLDLQFYYFHYPQCAWSPCRLDCNWHSVHQCGMKAVAAFHPPPPPPPPTPTLPNDSDPFFCRKRNLTLFWLHLLWLKCVWGVCVSRLQNVSDTLKNSKKLSRNQQTFHHPLFTSRNVSGGLASASGGAVSPAGASRQ